MVRNLVISLYVLLFWVILPSALVYPSILLDDRLDLHMDSSLPSIVFGIMLIAFSTIMLANAIRQFIRIGSELPISAFHTKQLIQTGLYGIWRHPIYLFYTLFFIGMGFILRSGAMLFIILPVFVLVESLYVIIEESKLTSRYGKGYVAYRRNTPLVIPHLQNVIRFPCLIFFKLVFHFRIVHREWIPSQPPFFILAAHRNYFDPFFIGVTTSLPVYYITTFEVFRRPLSRFIFRKLNCIPKKRYLNDTQATREIVHKVDQQCVIMIFPEGERSWTGRLGSFKPQVLKLLKHYSSVPIVPIRIDGNYHAWPRWRQWWKQSQVTLTVQKPLTLSQDMSTDEIEQQLRPLLEPRDEYAVCASSSRAKGLVRVIYRCPVCFSTELLFNSQRISLFCKTCQTILELLPDFRISYSERNLKVARSLSDLYERIRIHQTDIRPSSTPFEHGQRPDLQEGEWIIARGEGCHYSIQTGSKMVEIANGDLILTNQHLIIIMQDDQVRIELRSIVSAMIESNNKLQIYQEHDDKLHQLTFDRESVLKWQDFLYEAIIHEQGCYINRT